MTLRPYFDTWRGQFQLLSWTVAALAVVTVLLAYGCLWQVQQMHQGIGSQVASIDAAARMAAVLQDGNARSAEFLLTGAQQASSVRLRNLLNRAHQDDAAHLQSEPGAFRDDLFDARRNMANAGEREGIATLETSFADYQFFIRLEQYELAHHRIPEARSALGEAKKILQDALLPAIERISRIDVDALERAGRQGEARTGTWNSAFLYASVLTALAMLGTLVLMATRTHRLLNLLMLVGLVLVMMGQSSLDGEFEAYRKELTAAVQDTYHEVEAEDDLRRQANAANAAFARAWLDPSIDPSAEAATTDIAHQIEGLRDLATTGSAALSQSIGVVDQQWGRYRSLVSDMRLLMVAGERDRALAMQVGGARDTFETFMEALGRVETASRNRFEVSLQSVRARLVTLAWWAWGPLLLGLASFMRGLLQRLQEF